MNTEVGWLPRGGGQISSELEILLGNLVDRKDVRLAIEISIEKPVGFSMKSK